VIQAVGQENSSRQNADADATSWQKDPSNENTPVSVGGLGGHRKHGPIERAVSVLGKVGQSNDSGADSQSGNTNGTGQTAQQSA
jgi:hypothetical protein